MLVLFASLMHLLWALMLVVNGGFIGSTAGWALRMLTGDDAFMLRAAIYTISALLPATLLWRPGSTIGLLSCMPQQILLILSGISAIVTITSGHFADGVVRPFSFLMMDQGIYVLLSILYSIETLDRFKERGD